jgi:hypothetical protein
MLVLVACGAGVYLGLHFSVLLLLPWSLFAAAAFIVSFWSPVQSPFEASGMVLSTLIGIHAGYMLGLTAREPLGQLLARLNLGQSKRI